jgi:hypothetical protein
MSEDGSFKIACIHCGGHIEAPSGYVGLSVPCPHCGQTIIITPTIPSAPPASSQVKVETSGPRGRKLSSLLIGGTCVVCLILAGAAYLFSKNGSMSAPVPKPSGNAPETPAQSPSAGLKSDKESTPPAKPIKRIEDLKTGAIAFDRQPGSSLVYATGTLSNNSDYQRFGVKIELDILDVANRKVGAASDYTQVIEPRKTWTFRALVTDAKASSAEVGRIAEEP